MNWHFTIGTLSSVAVALPVFIILTLKLVNHRSFPALMAYCFVAVGYNLLTLGYFNAPQKFVWNWGLANNLLDAPLMLYFLSYFSPSMLFKKRMYILIGCFIVFEIITIALMGLSMESITVILGPGLLSVFGFCLYFFVCQAKLAIKYRKATGKALMVSALLFQYGCFLVIYLMYYIFKAHLDEAGRVNPHNQDDTFLIYFLVTIFASLLLSAGIIIESRRIHKLNELKITRKELLAIYSEKSIAPSYKKAAMLDFDKE